jgi:hypothetical protein
MKQSIALLTLTFALNASAGCPAIAPDKAPEIPDGRSASADSLRNARAAFQSYVDNIENFLNCRGQLLNDNRYDEWVDRAVNAAGSFNAQLQRYELRKDAVAKN